MKRALLIGIDAYAAIPLSGCVADASAMADTLSTNGNGSPNFDVRLLTSDRGIVTTAAMSDAIAELFSNASGKIDTALLFFAGHGIIDEKSGEGFIVSQDGARPAWGITLTSILKQAQEAHAHVGASVIILDSCSSGFIGEVSQLGNQQVSVIGNGVTILTASHREGVAKELGGHGVFTSLLLDGLHGSASDILGRVTPAAVYSLIDQTLGSWEQRPIYKANVSTFVTLRNVSPKIEPEILRKLPTYFSTPSGEFPLDPSYEPDRENIPERFRHLPIDESKIAIFKELQQCNRQGLVVPVGADHMYDAAIQSKACRLTATGAHYWKLALAKRL